jgi:hypothetical protein
MKLVPTPRAGHPNTLVRVPLGGATYAIRWLWNQRDRAWTFSMWDPSGEPLAMGVRVVLGVDLLGAVGASDRRPLYGIGIVDPSGKGQEPNRETLGSRIKAVYLEPDR